MNGLITPDKIYKEYKRGVEYKQYIDLYHNVEQNENFFIGRQWEGVNAPDLDKPVINILGRVVNFIIAMLCSDSIGVNIACECFDGSHGEDSKVLQEQVNRFFEQNDVLNSIKDYIRSASVQGDCVAHLYFDPTIPMGKRLSGAVKIEQIDNTNLFFGNPLSPDKENQPYIILSSRVSIDKLRDVMKGHGCPKSDIDSITPDGEGVSIFENHDTTTVLCRYWKENGTVWVSKATKDTVVMKAIDTGYTRYPVILMNWEKVRGSYHGQSAITGLIPNQIAINKLFAMAIKYQREMAFPKILYDRTKIDHWSNKIGAIAVNGDPNSALIRHVGGVDMSNQVVMLVDRLVNYTRDMLGASDVALGNIKPNNASAIIAVQQSTAIPLDIKKRELYRFIEEIVRVFLDMISVDYGIRMVKLMDENQDPKELYYNFKDIRNLSYGLNIDIGQAPYFSELAHVATLDNLYSLGIITDAIDYLEAIPNRRIKNKSQLIEKLRKRREEMGGEPSEMQQL